MNGVDDEAARRRRSLITAIIAMLIFLTPLALAIWSAG